MADLTAILADLQGFQWDAGNSAKSLHRHEVTQAEAEAAFFNRPVLVMNDVSHSIRERRFALHGVTNAERALTVTFTICGTMVRVISARDMSRKERRAYEKAIHENS